MTEREREVISEYSRKFTSKIMTFAVCFGVVMIAVVLLVYVLDVVEEDLAPFIFIGVAFAGAIAMTTVIMTHQKNLRRDLQRARGENPLF